MNEPKKMYINGQWTKGTSGKVIESINPATGEVLDQLWESSVEDAKAAVDAAKKSFYETREWRDMDSQTRADILLQIADLIDENRDTLAKLDTLDSGKPLRESEGDVDDGLHTFRYYAGIIKAPYGGVYDVNDAFGKMHSYTVHEPIGVVGQITPWNYPFLMSVWKLAPALAAGNSVILKPSPKAPLSTIFLFELLDSLKLPAGCVNLLQGDAEVGSFLAESTDVDMICFTGSTPVGQSLQKLSAGNLKRVGLELGGKSPNIIFADVDIESAVEWAMVGAFFNQGEVCAAGSRILVEASIKEEFVNRLVERANAMTVGNGLNSPDMGPLITEKDFKKVLRYINEGVSEGAVLRCGGLYQEGDCSKGYFIRPTVLDQCASEMKVVKEEIFGPVVTIQTFTTEEEAITMANDTLFGLAGAVATNNLTRALRVVKEIRAGITWVNCYNPTFNEAPWGGYKMSGNGRELGVHGLEEYQEIKQININLSEGPLGWYEN